MSTITPTQPMPSPAPLASPAVYRMTVDEFERIADSLNDDHVELIDGYIVRSEELKPSHVDATEFLRRHIEAMLPSGWHVREDKPLRIPEFSEPRPDVMIVRGDWKAFRGRHPVPADVSLVIEVPDTTLARDRGEKWIGYARSGIPVYWIVNLVDHQLEVYTEPTVEGYASRVVFAQFVSAQSVPVVIDGVELGQIDLTDILA
jgi:Uma2 family endonuclease